jgi:hypothetical protein
MEETKLEHSRPESKLKLFTMGLNLEIQPYWLIKQMISQNSQSIIDELIEAKYKEALSVFITWQHKTIENIKNGEDGEDVFVEYKYNTHVQVIQDIADISRDLLPLHSDYECIELSEEQKRAKEIAYGYWRYNNFYGFKKDK